ncbi:MAG TPA: hypothetical protein VGP04_18965 [Pseudonocardiaceae bacterium]|jgi:hypothetical protein|nr:hypothetical protein [Pseudonocardiaceae bacterium]
MRLVLHPDPTQRDPVVPTVDLRLITSDRDRTFWEFGHIGALLGPRSARIPPEFAVAAAPHLRCNEPGVRVVGSHLAAVGWLKGRRRFFD